jgi:hypothetical protein
VDGRPYLERQKLLVPELGLFALRKRAHVSNYGRFLRDGFIDLPDQIKDLCGIAPHFGVVSAGEALHVEKSSTAISLLRGLVKCAVSLQGLIVFVQQRLDPRLS